MKTGYKLLIVVLILTVAIPAGRLIYLLVGYNKAIHLIEEQSYSEVSWELLDYIDSPLFPNAKTLYYYSEICMLDPYEDAERIHSYLYSIPKNYSGKFADEIKAVREYNEVRYPKYLEEKERQRAIEIEQKRVEYASVVPFEGMSKDDIDLTMLGRHDKFDSKSKYKNGIKNYTYIYSWYADWYDSNSKSVGLVVECEDGVVTRVIKKEPYWTLDEMPNTTGKPIYRYYIPSRSGSSSKSDNSSRNRYDVYDVYDYDDPEDFYYDNEDEFEDYEDAEDYFYEAWDE